MTAEDFGITDEQYEEAKMWGSLNRRITRFRNNSTLKTFQEIFGDEEGERLRDWYFKLKFDLVQFETYLTTVQYNAFIAYILNNYEN